MTPEGHDAETTAAAPRTQRADAHGRFLPGTILQSRYRIVALAGRGGMGEVYRADDLRLGQTVALKFLPSDFERDPDRMRRLLGEVRVAREVSHPNVCRVHDAGEFDGHTFITMEFVDGEDLAALLRRIGRLPHEKALDLARQISAGLAAAHAQGIVHRDLKPANVMIDGRGRARITDFGLAGAAESMSGAQALSGTPDYMAPEQLEHGEATPRTDVYALGLLLYEMFTGKRPSPADLAGGGSGASPTPRPSTVVPGLDPAIDAAILKSLEREPSKRPSSAAGLLAMLPGGDPLAAALSAGETPSPEMVAASGEEGTLSAPKAWGLLASTILVGAVAIYIMVRATGLDQAPMSKTPDSLRDRSREIARALGGDSRPRHDVWWMGIDGGYLDWYRADPSRPPISGAWPSPVGFGYRQSAEEILPSRTQVVTLNDPPLRWSGDIFLATDSQGHLLRFTRWAPQMETPDSSTVRPSTNWAALLGFAGVDTANLRSVEPTWVPDVPFDSRAAWIASSGSSSVRLEAAAWKGTPVWLRTIAPWTLPGRDPAAAQRNPLALSVFVAIVSVTVFAFGFLARRNLKLGRSDRQGALRVGLAVFLFYAASHALQFRWALDSAQFWRFLQTQPAFPAVASWLFYLGLEPYLRRRWPHRLIAWARLLEGRVRDPLVGREILLGTLAGSAMVLLAALSQAVHGQYATDLIKIIVPFGRATDFWGSIPYSFGEALMTGLGSFAFLLVLRLVLRHDLAAWIGLGMTGIATSLWTVQLPALEWLTLILSSVLFLLAMRVGVLAAVAAWAAYYVVSFCGPLTLDPGRWYAWRTVVVAGLLLGIALWGFRAVMGRRRILSSDLLES